MSIQILDCTLRDGGYYTNWDFESEVINEYFQNLKYLPVDYVEIGYRNKQEKDYYGEFLYCPISTVKHAASIIGKEKVVIMLNEKDMDLSTVKELIEPVKDHIGMVRFAMDPKNIDLVIPYVEYLKGCGLKVGLNFMYFSILNINDSFIAQLKKIAHVDFIYLVDSFGSMVPDDVFNKIALIKNSISTPLGFHGHNNLELALINSIKAVEAGAEIIDSTITGMGRGAGNLKTELFLSYLFSIKKKEVDFRVLSDTVNAFQKLWEEYRWGTNLPYMISGAFSLPQKDVMSWIEKRRFSVSTIIQKLMNQQQKTLTDIKLPGLNSASSVLTKCNSKPLLIIGGGDSVKKHINGIRNYLLENPSTLIVYSSVKHISLFEKTDNTKILGLVGSEGEKLKGRDEVTKSIDACILPPSPRLMGTFTIKQMEERSYEVDTNNISSDILETPLGLALSFAQTIKCPNVYIVGFDGYNAPTPVQQDLEIETQNVIDTYKKNNIKLISLTPTKFKNVEKSSIYSLL